MCKYCEEDFDGFVKPLDKNAHVCVFDKPNKKIFDIDWYGYKMKIPIAYCPMCGRKLGDEDKIEVGEYIRTIDGDITKVKSFLEVDNIYSIVGEDGILYGNPDKVVQKHSKNIIDLIEKGDVIKYRIDNISTTLETCGYISGTVNISDIKMLNRIKNDSNYKILSIVTHQQFSQIEYKGEEKTNGKD